MKKVVVSLMVAALLASCASTHPVRHENRVIAMLTRIPAALASEGPTAWLRFFDNTPDFFMVSDGEMVFRSNADARAFLSDFSQEVESISIAFTDMRVEVLGTDTAAVKASYEETIIKTSGEMEEFAGIMTGVVRRRAAEWRFASLHWSSPKASDE